MSGGDKLATQMAAAEKDAIAYIDCVFHRRYAQHMPLLTLLQDMTHLKSRTVLGYVGAMPFCQRAFLQTRTHLYRLFGEEIALAPREYRDALLGLVDYVNARTRTTVADLYSYCSAAFPALVKGEIGAGLTVFGRFLNEHPTLLELVEPAPSEPDRQQVRSAARLIDNVLLFPKIKIAVGRVVNLSGSTGYLECQGEFISFHALSAGLTAGAQLKQYLMKGDMVPFEARHHQDALNGGGGGGAGGGAPPGVSSAKLRHAWRAVAVELPRGASSPSGARSPVAEPANSPLRSPFESPVKLPASKRPSAANSNSYMAAVDEESAAGPGWPVGERRPSQKRDSSTASLTAPVVAGGAATPRAGLLTPPFSAIFSRNYNPFLVDAEVQAGGGRPCVDKHVQTDVTDEELMLKLLRKYPNLLENAK